MNKSLEQLVLDIYKNAKTPFNTSNSIKDSIFLIDNNTEIATALYERYNDLLPKYKSKKINSILDLFNYLFNDWDNELKEILYKYSSFKKKEIKRKFMQVYRIEVLDMPKIGIRIKNEGDINALSIIVFQLD